MKVVCRRREGFVHDVEIEDGAHRLVVDEPEVAGGANEGPAPTRLLAASLASCVAITMEMYAQRKGWNIGDVEVEVDVEYEDYTPTSFTSTIRLPAELSKKQRERLLLIAGKCPVHQVLHSEPPVVIIDRLEQP